MATKIKKISELEKVTALSDSSNVVIEENGKAKRIAASNFAVGGSGGEAYVQPDEPIDAPEGALWVDTDEEFENGSSGGVSSWNDLTDKPFYEEKVALNITHDWSDVLNGDVSEDYIDLMGEGYFIHVSDEVLTDELVGMTLCVTEVRDGVSNESVVAISSDFILPYDTNLTIVGEANLLIVHCDNFDFNGIIFPKAGIYFSFQKLSDGAAYTTSLSGESNIVKKLDEKYTNNPVTLTMSYTYNEDTGEYTDVTSDLGYDAVFEAWNNGQPVFVRTCQNKGERCPASIIIIEEEAEVGIITAFGVVYKDPVRNVDVVIGFTHPLMGAPIEMMTLPNASGSGLPTDGINDRDMMIFNGETGKWENVFAADVVAEFAPSGLPEVTDSNEGAFLRIVDGVVKWVLIENAEDGAY